jgi:hypothetical protein
VGGAIVWKINDLSRRRVRLGVDVAGVRVNPSLSIVDVVRGEPWVRWPWCPDPLKDGQGAAEVVVPALMERLGPDDERVAAAFPPAITSGVVKLWRSGERTPGLPYYLGLLALAGLDPFCGLA